MKIADNSLERQKKRCADFSEKHNIPLQDIYAEAEKVYDEKYKEVYDSLIRQYNSTHNPEELTEDTVANIEKKAKVEAERRSLIRGCSIFKRKASVNQKIKKNGIPAFIVMRFSNNNFDQRAIKKIDEFIEEKGREEALKMQYIDSEDNYYHCSLTTSFSNQYGQKIDPKQTKGAAIGFFEIEKKDGTKEYDARYVRSNYIETIEMPICQSCIAEVKEGSNQVQYLKRKIHFG